METPGPGGGPTPADGGTELTPLGTAPPVGCTQKHKSGVLGSLVVPSTLSLEIKVEIAYLTADGLSHN